MPVTDAALQNAKDLVDQLNRSISGLLESQRVRLLQGSARFLGPHEVEVTTVDGTEVLPADAVLIDLVEAWAELGAGDVLLQTLTEVTGA
jgi:dihydrolipoamide dehydrogenase